MERAPFVSRQHVHFDMLDLMGILHNAAYLLLFERARTDYWRSAGVGYGAEDFDWPYLVARNEVDYRAPIGSDQEVCVTVSVTRIGRSSVTFAHKVFTEEGVLSAEGSTVLVRVEPIGRKATIPWSDGFRALIAPILAEP